MRQCLPYWLFCPSSTPRPYKSHQVLLQPSYLRKPQKNTHPPPVNFLPITQHKIEWRCCWQEVPRRSFWQQAWYWSYSTWCTEVSLHKPPASRLSTLYCIGTSSETVVDCPKTESMSKKTSMISSVWFFTFTIVPTLISLGWYAVWVWPPIPTDIHWRSSKIRYVLSSFMNELYNCN